MKTFKAFAVEYVIKALSSFPREASINSTLCRAASR